MLHQHGLTPAEVKDILKTLTETPLAQQLHHQPHQGLIQGGGGGGGLGV